MQKYRESFAVSERGRIYAQLPIRELATQISSRTPAKKPQGNKPLFPPGGEIALMFLKPYKELTGIDTRRVGADTIYANNENRKHCTEKGITTCFARF